MTDLISGPLPSARPRRGKPADTRARLVAAAARIFNRDGYYGTDSNRIARAAGYAPATFYKHFSDKRAIFLAAYEAWVTAEWASIADSLGQERSAEETAADLVDLSLSHHRRWRGLRASLRALVARDRVVRSFYRAQRRRQLAILAAMGRSERRARAGEEDAILLFTMERVCDALAEGEVAALGLSVEATLAQLREIVARHIRGSASKLSV
jgi:AcrR family transcriptional regulator